MILQEQEAISIPIIYIETFVMLLGAFLIGYIGSTIYHKSIFKKGIKKRKIREKKLELKIKALQSEIEDLEKVQVVQDRMNQDINQVQFHERAFSDEILEEGFTENEGAINFDVIGRATAAERDTLQDIAGIGPYTEAKLNKLGIYTFDQISKFTEEDIETVTRLIRFFPDRIKNDQWIAKARAIIYKRTNSDYPEKQNLKHKKTT